MFPHLIDWKYTIAHHSCFCSSELWEDQSWTIAQNDFGREMDGLEILGLAWGGGDADFFTSDEGVDGTGFTDVRISD